MQIKYYDDETAALQAYKNNEVDIVGPDANDIASITADASLRREYVEYPGACTSILQLNVRRPPFDDKRVRQAFAYGFDRSEFARTVFKDSQAPALTWIPPGVPRHDRDEQRFAGDILIRE